MRKPAFTTILLGSIVLFTSMAGATERHVPSQHETIQEAINDCNNGDVVIVSVGTYTGDGNRDLDFGGRAITVRSTDPDDPCIVAATIIDCNGSETEPHRGFYFINDEEANSILEGLTITNGYIEQWSGGGGIYIYSASPTISRCIITNNHAELSDLPDYCYGGGIKISGYGNPLITHCSISNNSAGPLGYGGGISCGYNSNATIRNCLITNNTASLDGFGGGIYCDGNDAIVINCTIAGNSASTEGGGIQLSFASLTVTNCTIWGNSPNQIDIYGPNNVTITYNDVQDGWLGPGNIDSDPCFANEGSGDYHLKSQAGRWMSSSQSWVKDTVTSPCVDTGDPNSDWTAELWPHGKRINMGAYGGTSQASMSLSSVGNIANLDNDPCDTIDFNDLALFVEKWLYEEVLLSEDLDRNGTVNFVDYAIFAQQWLYAPAEPSIEYRISDCQMGMAAMLMDGTRFTVTVEGRNIHFTDMMSANCCATALWLEMTTENNLITIYEHEEGGYCLCICDYPVTATIGPFNPGTYTLEVYEDWGGFIGSTTVVIE